MSLFCDYCNVAFPSGCICGKISLYKLWAPELDKVNKLKKENAKLRECVETVREVSVFGDVSEVRRLKKLASETLKELEGGE